VTRTVLLRLAKIAAAGGTLRTDAPLAADRVLARNGCITVERSGAGWELRVTEIPPLIARRMAAAVAEERTAP
jgi:hypothetical protein